LTGKVRGRQRTAEARQPSGNPYSAKQTEVTCALKTDSEWLEWDRRDPLFGVASWSKKNVDGAAPWTEEESYSLGALD